MFEILLACVMAATTSLEDGSRELDTPGASEAQYLELPAELVPEFTTVVRLGEIDHAITLRRCSVRSDGFGLYVQGSDGGACRVTAPAPLTYRGAVDGMPGSWVGGTLREGQLTARVELSPVDAWQIEPLGGVANMRGHTAYSLVNTDRAPLFDAGYLPPPDEPETEQDGGIAGSGLLVCEVGVDTNFGLYDQQGSVEGVLLAVESTMNLVSHVYERDLSVAYEVTAVVVRMDEESDPYADDPSYNHMAITLANEWNANFSHVPRDVLALLQRGLGGGGVSVSDTCAPQPCRLVAPVHSVNVVTHEFGHTWWLKDNCGPPMDCGGDCFVMDPSKPLRLSDCEISFAQSLMASEGVECLTERPAPLNLTFSESFATTTLDTDKWTWSNGVEINGDADNEPSGPYALNLDASDPEDDLDENEIRSNFIRLYGASSVTLYYRTEHKGVEDGETLLVEYWSDDLAWETLNTVTSNGTDQTSFTTHSHSLPGDALHDQFRLRFRPGPEVDDPDDDWYVDDVLIVGTPGPHDEYDLTIELESHDASLDTIEVTVAPKDENGNATGEVTTSTPLERTYIEGTTVFLHVDAFAESETDAFFARWEFEGARQPFGRTLLAFDIEGDVTATAIFSPELVVSIGAELAASPGTDINSLVLASWDHNVQGAGITPFTRDYLYSQAVTLGVVERTTTHVFCVWKVDGSPEEGTGDSGICSLDLDVEDDVSILAIYALIGDMNGDDAVDAEDIDPFFLALSDYEAYASEYPGLDGVKRGDANGDGGLDAEDIDPFYELL